MERERREEEKMYSAIQQGAGRKAIEAVRADSSMQMKEDEMSITRKLAKLILTLLTLPLLVVVWLLKWFVMFLYCCSAWIFYLLGSVLFATAVLSFLMKQSQGMEALQMLIGGFVIFMIPQVVGSVAVFLELVAATIRQVWYI